MPMRFKILFCFRILSWLLVLLIPSLHSAAFFPFFVLPLTALFSITAASIIFGKTTLNTRAAFLLSCGLTVLFSFFILVFLALIASSFTDILYLRIRILLPVLLLVQILCGGSTIAYLKIKRWKTFEPVVLLILFACLFWNQADYQLSVFSHSFYAGVFAAAFTLLCLVPIIVEVKPFKKLFIFFTLFILLIAVSLLLILNTYNKFSVAKNGGLLQQTLFKFDFSPFLTLQDEIKISDNLLFLVHIQNEYSYAFLRRMYLGGWEKDKGFYEKAAYDEVPQTTQLPKNAEDLPHQKFGLREKVSQEYFIVNIDSRSFMAIDYPTKVIPYKIWDTLSFNSAYQVESEMLHNIPQDMFTASAPTGNSSEGLSKKDFNFYTQIDSQTAELVQPIAKEVTKNAASYNDKILLLQHFLIDGEYRYSLKPGKASDGDQLKHFLTVSKKGYCTYFAFAYCLMLRSLEIPARVAVGFFMQPESGVLNYYPVRANMAHAWVEVFFPNIGWVTFDPTSQQLAEGENLEFSFDSGGDEFNRLLSEILENRKSLTEAYSFEPSDSQSYTERIKLFIKQNRYAMLIIFAAALVLTLLLYAITPYLIIRYSKNNRKIILTADKVTKHTIAALHPLVQKAKFAPECTDEDSAAARTTVKSQKKKIGMFFFCIFSFSFFNLFAETPENLLRQAEIASNAENWDKAIELLQQGIKEYPLNTSFALRLGELYYDNQLYQPSYNVLKKALKLSKENASVLHALANSAAALNKDEEARELFLQYLDKVPADLYTWVSYGWQCFKTHKAPEGIKALEAVSKKYGEDSGIYNVLGNLYSELFNYQKAEEAYNNAIRLALKNEQRYSASVYYYNKAILESNFYLFDKAVENAKKSNEVYERASGTLMLAELEARQNNFLQALQYFIKAAAEDKTPLSYMGLAETYLRAGNIQKAESFLLQSLQKKDESWISNYGMSLSEYRAVLYSLLQKLYQMKYAKQKITLTKGFREWCGKQKNLLTYSFYAHYYQGLADVYNSRVIKEYEKNKEEDESYRLYRSGFYYKALQRFPHKALPYLIEAEKTETFFIPTAKPSYMAEKALLLKDPELINKALNVLDSQWEKELLEKLLGAACSLEKNKRKKAELAGKLFRINPAAFIHQGLKLPVRILIQFDAAGQQKISETKFTALLEKSLFTQAEDSPLQFECRYQNSVFYIAIKQNAAVFFEKEFPLQNMDKKKAIDIINSLSDSIFTSDY
ncbi:transglutaminase domain-containing protein [Treponema phagedenis]|nr:transglutaminase domain-containing protein [Treponema phagedenis]NVP23296.1 tetratricopeptide repeat protein [Treponema phagedenis]QKS92613.1 tetratricopeptide repeat protein [Treponema phagedenis]QLC58151.1 tetratricopeptide repeat protein [Treponema phagedenis]CEM60451.1 Tetratricopeptide repeat protein [Treponema phagedenis]